MADTSLTFKKTSDSDIFRFILEPEENNGTTVFAAGTTARLKLYPGGLNPTLKATYGSASFYGTNHRQTVTEFIIFKDSKKASASFPVDTVISAVWQGEQAGNPVFSESAVILSENATAVLRIEYETVYDIVDVTCGSSVFCLVSAEKDGRSGIYALDFTDDLTGTYNRTVVLTVRDACTKKKLKDAHVYLNGKYAGKSDSEGRVRLGSMKSGTYSLLVEKEGYKTTDADNICNDTFTVS